MRYLKFTLLSILAMALAFSSCVKEEIVDNREKDYGYVQFKLYKAASYETKAVELEYLKDVAKVKVTLSYGENLISQTLVMNAANDAAAEFGLRSEKLQLLAGDYKVVTFALYNKMDEEVYQGTPSEDAVFTVVPGGLCVQDLLADVTPRGSVRFTIAKDMSAFQNNPMTKAGNREYSFDEIKTISITVKNKVTGVKTEFEKLPAKFSIHFDDDDKTYGYQTSSLLCDTLVSLKAGTYVIDSYVAYDDTKSMLESNSKVNPLEFVVSDNQTTEAKVPVRLYESDEYLKDYYALYEIWTSLNGKDWYYVGEDFNKGMNWDFNKDPDLWGDQPGVSLHANGRVALLNLSDFGFHGHLPAAIGQLTELIELYLGTHNDQNLLDYDPTLSSKMGSYDRMAAHKEYLSLAHPAEQFSEPIARALAEKGIKLPETALYDFYTESELIDKETGRSRIQKKDIASGKLVNGLKSIDPAIGKLTKLEKLFIANGELETLPDEMAKLVSCTDLEIYNCPKMTTFPKVIAKMPELVMVNLSNNKQWTSEVANEGLKALTQSLSKEKIQILYMNENNLTVVPETVSNMKKLGLLDLSNNKISLIEKAFGKDVNLVQLYLDNNKLTSIPKDANGNFCGVDDVETMSFSNNLLTKVPNIFSKDATFQMGSVNFSYNLIDGFEGEEDGSYRGIKVGTLTLNNNPTITKYPKILVESGSIVSYVSLRGCSISEVPEGSFTGETAVYITSIDLSYNKVKDLPKDFHAGNMPYLYGVELSYNMFSEFPWEPLDCADLTVFALRGQRDENGNRCLSEWPTGIYNHKGLRGFYIGSNNLGKIDDTISTLCYYLDISDNPEIIFDASDICYAYAAGAYYLIFDKTQDIRNCEYMK